MDEATPRGFFQRHRGVKIALLAVGGLVGALLIAILAVGFLVDLGGIAEKQLKAIAPKVQAQVGRDLRFGRIHLRLLPSVRLEINDIVLDAPPGQTGVLAQPLLQVGLLRTKVAVGPLLWSFGRKVVVSDVEVSGLKVQIARTADGHLSYQDILDKLATQPESPPMTQDEIDRLGDISIVHAALSETGIYFYDLSSPYGAATPLRLDNIQFSAENVALFSPFSLTLDMALLAAQRNFHLALEIGPLPRDLQAKQPLALVRRAELEIQPIEIEPILRFLPPSPGVSMQRAKIEAKLKLETPANAGQLQLSASAAARGLVLEDGSASRLTAARRGQSTDVRIETQLAAGLLAGDMKIDKLELVVNDMVVSAQADLRSLWTAPAVNKLALSSRGLLLERLIAILPPAALPAGAELRGPLLIRGSAAGSPTSAQVEAALDLTPATIQMPYLDKPAGTPLSLELRTQIKSGAADIDRLGLTLGPLALLLKGKFNSADDLDLKLDTGSVDLDKLLRLLPTVEKSVPKGSRIDGDLRVSGTIKKQRDTLDIGAKITMANAKLDQGDITVRGNAELGTQIHSTPASSTIKADLDLTKAALRVPGSVDKNGGVPMELRANIERSGKLINVRQAELSLPGGTIRVVGQVDSGSNRLDLKIPPVDLDLSRLSQVLPALRKGAAGGLLDSKLRIGVSFAGNPNKLGTAHASLDQFDMSVAGGSLKGSADIVGLDEPRKITFNFVGKSLDLDRILGKGDDSKAEEPAEQSSGSTSVPAFVRRLDMNGRIEVDSGKYKGAAVRDLLLELTMSSGKLVIKTLRGQAFGGNVTASGSTIDFGPSKPRFSLRTKLERIELGQVLAMRGGETGKKLNGHGSFDLSADGNGLSWADIAPRVTGNMGLGLTDGKLVGAGVAGPVINPMLARMGKGLQTAPGERDLVLRDLNAQFSIANGRLQTKSPIKFGTEDNTMALAGSIGLDKTLALTGNLDLSPQTISKLTGGRLVPDSPIPVALRFSGSLTDPRVEPVDIERTVAALLGAIARGRGKELLTGAGGKQLQNVLGGLGGAAGGQKQGLPAGLPNLGGLGGLGAQPAQPATRPGAPPDAPGAPAAPAAPAKNDPRKALQEAGKRGLGGLFGR